MHEISSKIVLLRNHIILVIIVKINNLEEHRIYRLIDTFQLNDTSVVQQPLSTVVFPHMIIDTLIVEFVCRIIVNYLPLLYCVT